jgi:hypothetical protein
MLTSVCKKAEQKHSTRIVNGLQSGTRKSLKVQIYCYMLGFLGNMTSAPCCISLVTQQFLLHNNGFVAFP